MRNPGTVNQDIQSLFLLYDFLKDADDLLLVSDVARHRLRRSSDANDVLPGFVQCLLIEIKQIHFGILCSEAFGNSFADTTSRSCNDSDFFSEIKHAGKLVT